MVCDDPSSMLRPMVPHPRKSACAYIKERQREREREKRIGELKRFKIHITIYTVGRMINFR